MTWMNNCHSEGPGKLMKFNLGSGVIFANIKMKTIPWDGLVGYETCLNVGGIHPINSSLTSIKKPSFSHLLVVYFYANS